MQVDDKYKSRKHRQQISEKTGYFSIFGNVALALIKLFAGIIGHSYALIADGIESSADIFSSILVLLGIKFSNRPADKNHPYGHGRLEPLISILVGFFLVVAAFFIILGGIQNITHPHPLPKAFTLIVLAPIIIWKLISYRVVINRAKKTNQSSLIADARHHLSDSLTSLFAFIGIGLALLFNYAYADDWAALVAALFMLYNSYKIFRPALSEIMDEHLYDDIVKKVRTVALTIEGVSGTEKCFVRKLGAEYFIDLHAMVDGDLTVREGHTISHQLKDGLVKKIPHLGDVLIHIEPDDMGEPTK